MAGLLTLMLLTDARRSARVSPDGELVPLDEQDRGRWDARRIAEGHALVRERLASGAAPGRFQLMAAINAVHTDGDASDWSQVVALYDQLLRIDGSAMVRLNRGIAVGHHEGPEAGLAAIDPLAAELAGYHAFHAARARLLGSLGRTAASRAAYDAAIGLAGNPAEVAFLTRRRDAL